MIIACWNGKGGSGKTTTAVGLAGELAGDGTSVLLVDLDPQANATTWLLGGVPDGPGILDALTGQSSLADATYAVRGTERLTIAPASPRLARIAVELEDDPAPQVALRALLLRAPHPSEVMVLDCPPAFGELPVMALTAASDHVVPLKAAALDFGAVEESLRRANTVRSHLNPDLRLAGFVICAYDARTTVARRTEATLRASYPGVPVVRVPTAVVAAMAPGAHQLLGDYAPLSPAAIAQRNMVAALAGGSR